MITLEHPNIDQVAAALIFKTIADLVNFLDLQGETTVEEIVRRSRDLFPARPNLFESIDAPVPAKLIAPQIPSLTAKQIFVLTTLLRNGATDPNRRMKSESIASADGNPGDPTGVKRAAKGLKALALVDVRPGSGGGYWLTEKGLAVAKQIALV
jgi:hypothetical protein